MNTSTYRFRRLATLLVGLLVSGQVVAGPIIVDKPKRQYTGIVLATLRASRATRSVPALGSVLDPSPLIQLAGQIATDKAEVDQAQAKVVLEQQQIAQASALYRKNNLSLANYQKAQEDLAANQAALAVVKAKRKARLAQTKVTWGAAMATALRADSDPLPQLAAGKVMLVGLSLPPGTTLAAPPTQAEAQAAGSRFALRLIGLVPGMLGRYPGQSFLYRAAEQPGAPVGTTVSASLANGPEQAGVLVPWSAVVWRNGRALVFRARSDDSFEPLSIATDVPKKSGYFVTTLSAGDRVVVRGADLLLGQAKSPARGEADD